MELCPALTSSCLVALLGCILSCSLDLLPPLSALPTSSFFSASFSNSLIIKRYNWQETPDILEECFDQLGIQFMPMLWGPNANFDIVYGNAPYLHPTSCLQFLFYRLFHFLFIVLICFSVFWGFVFILIQK